MARSRQFLILMALMAGARGGAGVAGDAVRFTDDRFEDFAAGTSDDGGHNLYVSRDGAIRTINRFDLNQDGFLDVLFNCTHDTYQMLPATVGRLGAGREARSSDLAFEGTQQVAHGDLNRDGYTDLVACPNAIGVHHDRRFVMVAWGGPDGWNSQRINSPLPMNAAAKVAIADLNGDKWPDICVLGASRWQMDQPEGRILRIYWGSADGFTVTGKFDVGLPDAVDLAAADFDVDGAKDLAVLRSNGSLNILWSASAGKSPWSPVMTEIVTPANDGICVTAGDVTGDARADLVLSASDTIIAVPALTGRQWDTPQIIDNVSATDITIGDFDHDSHAELVLTRFGQARAAGGEQAGAGETAQDIVRILWGGSGGWSADQQTKLDVPAAAATAAGDLDGDGHQDLAIAVHQGSDTFNGESFVWFGNGRREFQRGMTGFATSGTLDVAVIVPEQRLPARAVFCNSIGGHLDEAVPLHLYWGGRYGFDPELLWKIPFHSGYEGSAADLNADGFPDLIVLNSGHSGAHAHVDPTLGANILWGGPEGIEKSQKRTVLHEHFLGTSSVADLNRDGWLDLVLEPFGTEPDADKEKLFLYYGSPEGFLRTRRIELILDGYAQEHLVADLNGDQWLDICVTTRSLNCARILWGSADGFDVSHEQRLNVSGPVGVDAADFNGDGRLDILIGSYSDPVSGHRDMGLILFWGGESGFQHSHAQWLPGFSPLGRTVADIDGDGFLDLVSPQHSGELTREDLASHIFWGSDTGFATRRRTTLLTDSVNDTMAADFNSDGLIDLAINSHTRHGNHRTLSKIFYNDGRRFSNPRLQLLPTNGPHLMWATDVGHIGHRGYRHSFVSRVFDWKPAASSVTLTTAAQTPEGGRLELSLRSAAVANDLASQEWRPITEASIAIPRDHRYAQYRLDLHSDNGDRYPVIDRVDLVVNP